MGIVGPAHRSTRGGKDGAPGREAFCGGCHRAAYSRARTSAAWTAWRAGWLGEAPPVRAPGPSFPLSSGRLQCCIQAEAHAGAQHPGVLYFSLRLKLLASELLAHPSSLQLSLCYSASLKLHCRQASCMSGRRCIEEEHICSSSRGAGGEELTVLIGWIDEENNRLSQG